MGRGGGLIAISCPIKETESRVFKYLVKKTVLGINKKTLLVSKFSIYSSDEVSPLMFLKRLTYGEIPFIGEISAKLFAVLVVSNCITG